MKEYGANQIKVLKGLEPVRKRPGMYIGDTGERGLHHLVWEVLDNSTDEALAGFGDKLIVRKFIDNSIEIEDFGRGVPSEIHPTENIPTVDVIFTILHAGGKFDSDSYKVSGGLHGVGAAVANALSEYLEIEVHRDNRIYNRRYEQGIPIGDFSIKETKSDITGTIVRFKPDILIFKNGIDFKKEIILKRLQETAFLNKTLTMIFEEELDNGEFEKTEFHYENGLTDYILYTGQKDLLFPPIEIEETDNELNVKVNVAISYKDKAHDTTIKSFNNNIVTPLGGTHEVGTITAIRSSITQHMKFLDMKKYKDLTVEDIKEGLICFISVYVEEPELEGQTKGKLNNSEAQKATYKIVKKVFQTWLEENPRAFKKVVKKVELALKAREASKKSRETVRKTELDKGAGVLPSKLSDCQSRNAEECEIYLVEGDSAGGSAKQGRNKKTQAILPLKGKVINVFRAKMDKIEKNTEINSMISAYGVGHSKNIDMSKLRYGKVIIMTDADIDGGHIAFLLLLVHFKLFFPIIAAGNLYIAIPPLYRVKKGEVIHYFADDKELEIFFRKEYKDKKTNINDLINNTKWIKTRFKGLGEMNPKQLAETSMNPETRKLVKITIPKETEGLSSEQVLNLLGAEDSEFRKRFLMKFAKKSIEASSVKIQKIESL